MRELAGRWVGVLLAVVLMSTGAYAAVAPPSAGAGVVSSVPGGASSAAEQQSGGSSLESAAAKAGNTGRAVAMSLIGLAFAVAGTVLAFRRDFKEAGAVFAVGIISVLLATPAGVSLLRDTVTSLFGSR
jgi:hypothetical protein